MSPSKATAGKGGPKGGGTITIGGRNNRAENDRSRIADDAIEFVLDEVERLLGENESLRAVVDVLSGDVEALKGDVAALATGKGEPCPATAEGTPAKKRRRRNKKKKHDDGGGHSWGAVGPKIAAGSLSVALLISISIALGQGAAGKHPRLIWGQKHGRTGSDEETENAVGSLRFRLMDVGGEMMTNAKVSLPRNQIGEDQTSNSQVLDTGVDSYRMHNVESTDQAGEGITSEKYPFEQSDAPKNLGDTDTYVEMSEVAAISRVDEGEENFRRILQLIGSSAASDSPSPEARSPSTAPALLKSSDRPVIAWESVDEYGDFSTAGDVFDPGYVCDADPATCGCPNLHQADYRGSISTTREGWECERWDAEWVIEQSGLNYGLEGNFCRNPFIDFKTEGGAWCWVVKTIGTNVLRERESCDVPTCGALTAPPTTSAVPTSSAGPTGSPSSSSLPSSSFSPTQICPIADNEVCGCDVVSQIDYRGPISTAAEGFQCERWDSEWVKGITLGVVDEVRVSAGLEDNFCRNPAGVRDTPWCFTLFPNPTALVGYEQDCDIPHCNPCSCMPPCGTSNDAACPCPSVLQADECCEEGDASCRCGYLRDACRKSLENNSTDFCQEADIACCEGNANANCKCTLYEQLCSESASQNACDFAAGRCCEFEKDSDYERNTQCYCDFHTYSSTFLIDESKYKSGNCSEAKENQFSSPSYDKTRISPFYYATGGEYWINNTGWLDDTVPHCQWFGLYCNDDGLLIEISLRNNNLTGEEPLRHLVVPQLQRLDLSENDLWGEVSGVDLKIHRRLVHIDISGNRFSGHADMSFPPATLYVNYSNNEFTSAGFKKFNPAYETLQTIDVSKNRIDQDVAEMFFNIPPNIEELVLSNNELRGTLPNPFRLEKVLRLEMATNAINGQFPSFFAPQLKKLDLSNQSQKNGGLSGKIPVGRLRLLVQVAILNLAGNNFSGGIPRTLSNLQYLRVLNLSSNALVETIPSALGRLEDVLEVLDLSNNEITGSIPLELADLKRMVHFHLRGNPKIFTPAPLDLCLLPGFDLKTDAGLCPPERNALRAFYYSAKGSEWTESTSWLEPVLSHCDYYGVSCNEERENVIKLELPNNGLSGKLSTEIAALSLLEELDLSDNDIKGSIPKEIGSLVNLKKIRLCYNGFIGNETDFGRLQHLELIQIHGNRLSGTLPRLDLPFLTSSSFVSDCGNPSDFDESLSCQECTMCCNAQGDCHRTESNDVQKAGFQNYRQFSYAFIGCLFVASAILAVAAYAYDKYQNRNLPISSIPSLTDRDNKYALSTIGEDSVYQFFLGKSWIGWAIVLLIIFAQMWILFIFVDISEVDWSSDNSALVYTWKCPRNEPECKDTDDLDWRGWLAFSILMIAHLLKDIINGTKLIVLSAKKRHSRHTRIRFFVGGTILCIISGFTFFVSTIYNSAIATDNREIIENSVIILFIMDVDELLYDILTNINEDWVTRISHQESQEEPAAESGGQEGDDEEDGRKGDLQEETDQNQAMQDQSGTTKRMEGELQNLRKEFGTLQEMVKQQNALLNRFLAKPQDERDYELFLQRLNTNGWEQFYDAVS